jgi:hypothetical protein
MVIENKLDPSWAIENHSHCSMATKFNHCRWMVTKSNCHQIVATKNLSIIRLLWQLKNLLVSKPLYMAAKTLSVTTPLWQLKTLW